MVLMQVDGSDSDMFIQHNSLQYTPSTYRVVMFIEIYHQTSSIKCIKSLDLNVSRLVLQLSLPNPLKV